MHRWRQPVARIAVVAMHRDARRRRRRRSPRPASAAIDPTAEFFDDSVVHDLRLWINSRDWETLKTNFLSNAYYPADLQWKTTTVRNVGIRSRGNGSRSGFKPGLRVDIDRYSSTQKFLGAEVVRAAQQHAGSVADARVAQHAVLPAHGAARAARSVRAALRQQRVRRPLHDRRVGGQVVPRRDSSARTRDICSTTTTRRTRRRTTSRTAEAIRRAYVPLPFKPETHENNARPEVIADMVQAINTERRGVSQRDRRVHRPRAVHPTRGDRSVSRRPGRVPRRLGDEQLLHVSPRARESVQADRVGQEPGVRGRARRIPSGTTSPTCPRRTATVS